LQLHILTQTEVIRYPYSKNCIGHFLEPYSECVYVVLLENV